MTHPYIRLFIKSATPTVTDDAAHGYEVGDVWLYGVTFYFATDVTTGAAVWTTGGAIWGAITGSVTAQADLTSWVDGEITLALGSYMKVQNSAFNASGTPNYPSGNRGELLYISVAGKIGGSSGIDVEVGDMVICLQTNAGGSQALVGNAWGILQTNTVSALVSGSAAGGDLSGTFPNPTVAKIGGVAVTVSTDGTLSGNSDAHLATEKAVKTYTDVLAAGLKWKQSVVVATTGNGTLATAYENGDTIDGVVLATGDRILLKDQTAGAENGIYTVNASGAPTRSTDADSGTELVSASVFVQKGTTNADKAFLCTNDSITLGTTSITFVAFASVVGALIAANNLSDLASATTALTNLGLSANGKSLVTAANYSAMKTLLNLVIGTDVQAQDSELSALAGLASSADQLPYFTGGGTAALTTLSSFMRTVLLAASAAAAASTLQVTPIDGWISISSTNWTRQSNYVFRENGDQTTKYRHGTKIRWKEGGAYKYGFVISTAYNVGGSGATDVTMATNTDYTMGAGTLSDTYYSYEDNPEGFPDWFNFTLQNFAASGSMTVTLVSTTLARIRPIGTNLYVMVQCGITTGGTANTQIVCDAPVPAVDANSFPITAACLDGTSQTVVCLGVVNGNSVLGSTNRLQWRKTDASNWGIGSSRTLQIAGYYPF